MAAGFRSLMAFWIGGAAAAIDDGTAFDKGWITKHLADKYRKKIQAQIDEKQAVLSELKAQIEPKEQPKQQKKRATFFVSPDLTKQLAEINLLNIEIQRLMLELRGLEDKFILNDDEEALLLLIS